MIKKLWGLYRRHQEALLYLFFGGLTTVLNYIVYIGFCRLLPATTTIPNLIAWIVAVLFAYVTNRVWVFRSETHGFLPVCRELLAFAGARVFTLLLETAILYVAVDRMRMNNFVVKLLANVLVIVLNYVFSKLWIFRKKNGGEAKKNI